MPAKRQTVALRFARFAPYARNVESEWRSIPAYVVGDLAIHRPHYIQPGGELSHLNNRWTVSHVPTGDTIESAFPPRFKHLGAIIASKTDLVRWAEALQAEHPAFFEAAREGDKERQHALARDVLDTGRAL